MGGIGLISNERHSLASAEETILFGKKTAASLWPGAILALSGDLGSGKTTFVQGLAEGLGILEPIQSPTFILLNLYEQLAHFDLYRLKRGSDFTQLGFEEYLGKQRVCAIEWPEKIREILPEQTVWIDFLYESEGRTAQVRLL